eukprot:829778_1
MSDIVSTAQTPLLSSEEKGSSKTTEAMSSNITASKNNSEQELQFYDPAAIFCITREVAFGYLILLTGGAVEYEPPGPEDVLSIQQSQTSTSRQPPSLDEQTASLAYSAIVDGNLLHACFGLKATANGRINNTATTIGGKSKHSSFSMLCCFRSSSATLDAMQLVLPPAAKNALQMKNLVEVLREIQDLHNETLGAATMDSSKVPLCIQVIQAYIHCFVSIVRYHDLKQYITKRNASTKKGNQAKENDGMCSKVFKKFNSLFPKPKNNPQLELLQKGTLTDIDNGFRELRVDIWEGLERTAT